MKTLRILLTLVAILAVAFGGCSKSGVNTKPLEKSFSDAPPAAKSSADQAVSAIKAGDYAGALAELGKLDAQGQLTEAQRTAIRDTLTQVREAMQAALEKAGGDAKKGMEDLQKSLPK